MKKGFFFFLKKKTKNQTNVIFQKKTQQRKHKRRERVNKHNERPTWGEETWKEKKGEKREKARWVRRVPTRRVKHEDTTQKENKSRRRNKESQREPRHPLKVPFFWTETKRD